MKVVSEQKVVRKPFANENGVFARKIACIEGTGTFDQLNQTGSFIAVKVANGNDLSQKEKTFLVKWLCE